MVLVHEFGHFAAAKLCGVRVEAFAVGFGKRLFGIVHNGTDYRVNLLPLGGYVKMAGVGDEPISGSNQTHATNDPGELQNHPRWQRVIIALAGPVANFILAFVLMTALYMHHHEVQSYLDEPAVVDYISPGSPVAATGIQSGDRIVHFDNRENPTWGDLESDAPTSTSITTLPFPSSTTASASTPKSSSKTRAAKKISHGQARPDSRHAVDARRSVEDLPG